MAATKATAGIGCRKVSGRPGAPPRDAALAMRVFDGIPAQSSGARHAPIA